VVHGKVGRLRKWGEFDSRGELLNKTHHRKRYKGEQTIAIAGKRKECVMGGRKMNQTGKLEKLCGEKGETKTHSTR